LGKTLTKQKFSPNGDCISAGGLTTKGEGARRAPVDGDQAASNYKDIKGWCLDDLVENEPLVRIERQARGAKDRKQVRGAQRGGRSRNRAAIRYRLTPVGNGEGLVSITTIAAIEMTRRKVKVGSR